MSDSLWPHGLYSPWNSPGQNTGVGSLSFLQRIFPTQGSNPGLPHCRADSLPADPESWFSSVEKWQPTPVFLGFSCSLAGKESTCNVGDLGSFPRLGRSHEEEKGYPLQYSGLENSMDCIVHGVAKSQTWLSDFHFTSLHFIHQCFKVLNLDKKL